MGFVKGEYDWCETIDTITIIIPLKGTPPNKVDIDACPVYLKINFKPYLIHIDLHDKILFNSGAAKVNNGILDITFNKVSNCKPHEFPLQTTRL